MVAADDARTQIQQDFEADHLKRRKAVVFSSIMLLLDVTGLGQSNAVHLPSNFCSDFSMATTGCASFKELVDHHDAELLDILGQECKVGGAKRAGAAYACFKGKEDKFFVVAFNVPDRWKRSEHDSLEGRSSLCLDEYENGIPGGYQYFSFLEWLKLNEDDSPSDGHTPSVDNTLDEQGHVLPLKTEATVDPTEVTAAYSFHNKSGAITDYKLTIPRSTRRFVETWDAGGDTITETGYCAVFEQPDKETKK